jgi:23S rRNA (cytidine1920-2'-O)/16S rRNA (cytidine1409-2'-O)-methyltransferase
MMTRLDSKMVALGLAYDIDHARSLIVARLVKIAGNIVVDSGKSVLPDTDIVLVSKPKYVSRGGIKLAGAIERWNLGFEGMTALDVGASTGGFTDCLLQAGIEKVYSLDVGYGQLDYKLRQDDRVVVMERINARHQFTLSTKVDLLVVDVSFISVLKIIPSCLDHLKKSGTMIALIKPQFEARRDQVGKNGIVKSAHVHASVLSKVIVSFMKCGLRFKGLVPSVIKGHGGNQEFFVWFNKK